MKRPICVHCGKPYGYRDIDDMVIRRATANEPWPRYAGNGIVIKDVVIGYSATVAYRKIWDGETWVKPYEPFCTLRCALDYARKAYRQGVGARPPANLKAVR